jgi:hypothetical protein
MRYSMFSYGFQPAPPILVCSTPPGLSLASVWAAVLYMTFQAHEVITKGSDVGSRIQALAEDLSFTSEHSLSLAVTFPGPSVKLEHSERGRS